VKRIPPFDIVRVLAWRSWRSTIGANTTLRFYTRGCRLPKSSVNVSNTDRQSSRRLRERSNQSDDGIFGYVIHCHQALVVFSHCFFVMFDGASYERPFEE
ncbi:hypothetical protein PHET_11965, partial [Paragonimus heterotremus]